MMLNKVFVFFPMTLACDISALGKSVQHLKRIAATLLALSISGAASANFADAIETPSTMSELARTSRLLSVAGTAGNLIAVGPRGHILTSRNKGETWIQAASPVSSDLVAVRFVTSEIGWAAGHDGVLLKTTDGGTTWTKRLDGVKAAALMLEHYKARAAAGDAEAGKRVDEATRFVSEGADKPFLDVLFLSAREGFAVGAFNLSLHTKDGGETWVPLNDRTDNQKGLHLYGLAATDRDMFMVGEQGLLRRWNRHSERFDVLTSPYKGSFFGAVAKKGLLITFGMRGNAFRSRDAGQTWEKLQTKTLASITSGTVMPDGAIALVTLAGQVLVSRDDGDTFNTLSTTKAMAFFGVAPVDGSNVALVGPAGVFVESTATK